MIIQRHPSKTANSIIDRINSPHAIVDYLSDNRLGRPRPRGRLSDK